MKGEGTGKAQMSCNNEETTEGEGESKRFGATADEINLFFILLSIFD